MTDNTKGSTTAAELLNRLKTESTALSSLRTADALPPPGPRGANLSTIIPGESKDGIFLHEEVFEESCLHGVFPLKGLESLGCAATLFPELEAAFASPGGAVFLDTETTGLMDGALAFLVGLGRFEPGRGFVVRQYFVEAPFFEPALLELISDELARAKCLVTYNGAGFDLPLLLGRYARHRLSHPFGNFPHLDFLKPARSIWKGAAENCRLVTLECEVLRYKRVDDVEGRDIPGVYEEYRRFGRLHRMERVFYHNALDILSLAALLAVAADPASHDFCGLSSDTLHGTGLYHLKCGRVNEAAATLETALPLLESGQRRRSGLMQLFKVKKKAGDMEGALKALRSLRSENFQGDPLPWLEEAKILEKCEGDVEGALALLRELENKVLIPKDREAVAKMTARLSKKLQTIY